jgi:hypothetical protein
MKQHIIFWITTGLIVLSQSIGELLAAVGGSAAAGVVGLGYPAYVVGFLVVAKLLGGIVLIVPSISPRIKEWAYAGFMIDFILALYSMTMVIGITSALLIPCVAIILLILSYRSYHKIRTLKAQM